MLLRDSAHSVISPGAEGNNDSKEFNEGEERTKVVAAAKILEGSTREGSETS